MNIKSRGSNADKGQSRIQVSSGKHDQEVLKAAVHNEDTP